MSEEKTIELDERDRAHLLLSAVEASDSEKIAEILDPLPFSEALREVLLLPPTERDTVLRIIPATLAAELIGEAPNDMAVELVERLDPDRAATILEELSSDVKADVIGELDEIGAEAILSEMDEKDAADVRRLATYEDDTAGGLMVSEIFRFNANDTVGKVLRDVASGEDDFERYRGQHPYITEDNGRLVGVVSLRSLLTAKRSEKLSAIMVEPIAVPAEMLLEDLEDLFDEHPFWVFPLLLPMGSCLASFRARRSPMPRLSALKRKV